MYLLDCNEALCGGDHYLLSTWRNQMQIPPPKFCPPVDTTLIPDLKWVDFIGIHLTDAACGICAHAPTTCHRVPLFFSRRSCSKHGRHVQAEQSTILSQILHGAEVERSISSEEDPFQGMHAQNLIWVFLD